MPQVYKNHPADSADNAVDKHNLFRRLKQHRKRHSGNAGKPEGGYNFHKSHPQINQARSTNAMPIAMDEANSSASAMRELPLIKLPAI